MADRFPLIVDSSAEQLQELAVGDNLNLASSGLINADNIQTSGLSVGVMTATSFIGDGSQLTNLPAAGSSTELTASGTLSNGSKVIVNTDGTVSAAGLEGSEWIATLGGTGYDQGKGVAVDSSGNVYVTGNIVSPSTGYFDCSIAKYNSSGVIQWQRTLSSSLNDYGVKIALDSSGNVYIVGTTQTSGRSHVLIAKYNSSGSIQWQRTFSGTGPFDNGRGIAVDSSGNVYIAGFNQGGNLDSGNDAAFLAKYNTSGTLQWQRLLGSSSQDHAKGIAVDSSGNVYVVGDTVSSNYDIFIAKYNTSGSIQWQRTLGGTGIEYGYGIAVDSSGNAYAVGQTNSSGAGGSDFLIAKYNTSGAIQWQRILGGSGDEVARSIAVDNSGNVYVTGDTSAGGYDFLIAKYNSSGTIQWQRTLGGTGGDYPDSIQVDSSGNIYIAGYTNSSGAGSNDILIAKLPDDGSLTGTYGSFTYSSSSLTAASITLTSSTSSLTDSALSFTSSTSSLTESASSFTSSTTSMASTNLTAENFIGISDGAYSNGQTATVQLIGSVDDAQSSLTPGQKYYVQSDGTLSETADSPSVLAGTAIASTKLLIKK
jgi:uncharacterized delta-60 repeat protein